MEGMGSVHGTSSCTIINVDEPPAISLSAYPLLPLITVKGRLSHPCH